MSAGGPLPRKPRLLLWKCWSAARLLPLLLLGSMSLSVIWVELYRWVDPPFSMLMASRSFERGHAKIRQTWVDREKIPVRMKLAVLASEDQLFLEHRGFDLQAMQKAWDHNRKGRKLRGASTITQQLAKNLFLWEGRSYLRKGMEAWFTLLIETLWPKARILEVYLNVVELGPGLFGVEAASQAYFGHSVEKVGDREAVQLAVLLPSPLKHTPARLAGWQQRRIGRVLQQMYGMPMDRSKL